MANKSSRISIREIEYRRSEFVSKNELSIGNDA